MQAIGIEIVEVLDACKGERIVIANERSEVWQSSENGLAKSVIPAKAGISF